MKGSPTERLDGSTSPAPLGDEGPRAVLKAGEVFAGRFRIAGILGAGASSIVYRAFDQQSKVDVAVKVITSPRVAAQEGERIRREVEASWRLAHPNLVRVFDWGKHGGQYYLVMELCEGGTLRARLDEGRLSVEETTRVVGQVLQALSALHGAGIVHRDVKPDNCFLASNGSLKLGDLGVARAAEWATLTATGATLGTPAYMAPESIRGDDAGEAADLYAVGVLLFELLTGSVPFSGASALEVASKQLAEAPPLARLRETGVPSWLERLVRRLLEKDPADRYPSAKAVLRALARRSSGLALARRWRARLLAAFVVAVVTAAIAILLPASEERLDVAFHGSTLEVRDADGRVLWSHALPRPIQSVTAGRFGSQGSLAVAAALRWAESAFNPNQPSDDPDHDPNQIHVFDSAGRLLRVLPVRLRDVPYAPRYVVALSSHRFAPDEPERLVAKVSQFSWYPSGVLVYSSRDLGGARGGWQVARNGVYNSGAFSDSVPRFADVNGDGRDEIVYCAVNNRLYRTFFVGASTVPPEASGLTVETVSPDIPRSDEDRPLFYRAIASHVTPDPTPHIVEAGSVLRVRTKAGLGWTVDGAGELVGAQEVLPDARAVRAINDLITELCHLRTRGLWSQVLAGAERWPDTPLEPYGWLGRFFKAHALQGLGRNREVPGALGVGEGALPPGLPTVTYRFLLDSAFLGGELERVRDLFDQVPPGAARQLPDLANTAIWAGIYLGDRDVVARLVDNPDVSSYPFLGGQFKGLIQYFRGNFAEAERILHALHSPDTSQIIDPSNDLWLVEVLLRQGKLGEARAILEPLERRFRSEEMGDGETALWVRWRAGEHSASLAAQLVALAESKRAKAATDVDVRGFLPITLARAARAERELGDRGAADRLAAEARALAPPHWRRVLSGV